MATKKTTKQDNKGATATQSCVLYFTQFAVEELISENKFGLSIEGHRTYLTPKDFNLDSLKPYDIVGPKMNNFIKAFYEAIKVDFEKSKFESKYVKFLELLKARQHNVRLFELHKTSDNQTIRTISTVIKSVADQLTSNSADSSDDYMTLADLLCIGLSILVFRSSFISGSQVKDIQGFRRMLTDLQSCGYFVLDGSTEDAEFINSLNVLVAKTFETQAKSGGKKGQTKAQQSQQQANERRDINDNQAVDELLNDMM
jgi:hypothetical protein